MFPLLLCSTVLVDRRVYPEPCDTTNVMNILRFQFNWLSTEDRLFLLLKRLLEIDTESIDLLHAIHDASPFPTLTATAVDFLLSQNLEIVANACKSLDPRQFAVPIPINRDRRLQEIKRKMVEYLPIAGRALHRYLGPTIQANYDDYFRAVPSATWKFQLTATQASFELLYPESSVVSIIIGTRRHMRGRVEFRPNLGVCHFPDQNLLIDFTRGSITFIQADMLQRAVWNFQVRAVAFVNGHGDLKLLRSGVQPRTLLNGSGVELLSLTSSPTSSVLYVIYRIGSQYYLEICSVDDVECSLFALGSRFVEIDGDYVYVYDLADFVIPISFLPAPLHNSKYPSRRNPADLHSRRFGDSIIVADVTKPRLLRNFQLLCDRYTLVVIRRDEDFARICGERNISRRWQFIQIFIKDQPYTFSSIAYRIQTLLAL